MNRVEKELAKTRAELCEEIGEEKVREMECPPIIAVGNLRKQKRFSDYNNVP